jgi:hypothetical protein
LHEYTTAQGETDHYRIRLKHPRFASLPTEIQERYNGSDKWIRPFHLSGRSFEMGEPKRKGGKLLYRLHRIIDDPDAVVWVVEGEQKADALEKRGFLATTSGSATSAGAADWEPLRGRTCIIWPDNDQPGRAYAGEVASILLEMSCAISCLDVAALGLPENGDVMDWLAAHPGAAAGDLEALPRLASHGKRQNAPAGDSEAWPDPLPLPLALPPVKAFDSLLLPDSLRPWIEDVAERVQCPPDFAAVGAMISLAAVVGRKVGIRPKRKDDWIEVPNLWGAIIGRPGVMKSPALREAMRPLRRLEAKAAEAFADEARTWRREREVAKLKREA